MFPDGDVKPVSSDTVWVVWGTGPSEPGAAAATPDNSVAVIGTAAATTARET